MFTHAWKSFAKWSLTAAAVALGFGALSSTAQAQGIYVGGYNPVYGGTYVGGYSGGYGVGYNNGYGYGTGYVGSPYTIGPNYGNQVYVAPPIYTRSYYRAPVYYPSYPVYTTQRLQALPTYNGW